MLSVLIHKDKTSTVYCRNVENLLKPVVPAASINSHLNPRQLCTYTVKHHTDVDADPKLSKWPHLPPPGLPCVMSVLQTTGLDIPKPNTAACSRFRLPGFLCCSGTGWHQKEILIGTSGRYFPFFTLVAKVLDNGSKEYIHTSQPISPSTI